MRLIKYPRTPHLEGSRLQLGDEDLQSVPLSRLTGRHLVVEEKMDGANAGLRFDPDGRLLLQSRGHFLRGGPRERHFDLFKQWANTHSHAFRNVLGSRYVLYGEWLYAKHTIFYDALPHYFLEFDVLDTEADAFLATDRRRALLAALPDGVLHSVPIVWSGIATSQLNLTDLVGPSAYKTAEWRDHLATAARSAGADPAIAAAETDPSEDMEGLYVKVEEGGRVLDRYKYVRSSFLTTVLAAATHWLDRPIIPNQLRPGAALSVSRRPMAGS
jgi:hypothetical protein